MTIGCRSRRRACRQAAGRMHAGLMPITPLNIRGHLHWSSFSRLEITTFHTVEYARVKVAWNYRIKLCRYWLTCHIRRGPTQTVTQNWILLQHRARKHFVPVCLFNSGVIQSSWWWQCSVRYSLHLPPAPKPCRWPTVGGSKPLREGLRQLGVKPSIQTRLMHSHVLKRLGRIKDTII